MDRRPFSLPTRVANIERLARESYDVLVIGGGINGAGIARDAVSRGLKVALVEKGDFASGTSSKSSKLIHGGLRYLEEYHFGLVRAACRERDRLRKLAPHLVRPLPFLFPVYRGDPVGLVRLELGMLTYDLLAAFRNIRSHRLLTARRVVEQEPFLKRPGLRGAALYYDAWTDDARLTLETILSAHEQGAVIASYVAVRSFLKERGRLAGAEVVDELTGRSLRVSARTVVNATGPWLDEVRRLDDPAAADVLQATKGVHIVVPRDRVRNEHAIVARSPRDQRVLFILPWGDVTLVGTTDTFFSGSPDEVRADGDDVGYLLAAVNDYFPGAGLRPDDVISTFAGLRPLIRPEEQLQPSSVPREEKIFESASGLLSLGGGKLTTYRLVSREVVDLIAQKTGRSELIGQIPEGPLPGGSESPEQVLSRLRLGAGTAVLADGLLLPAVQRYGTRVDLLIDLIRENPDLAAPMVPGGSDVLAAAVLASRDEMAVKVDDILERRTHVGITAPSQKDKLEQRLEVILTDETPRWRAARED